MTERSLRHTRSIVFQAFERADGLWDFELRLTDVKPHVVHFESGPRDPGDPVHDMHVRITADAALTVREVDVTMDWTPYPGFCGAIAPAYRQLIGTNLRNGFRKRVAEVFAGTGGCTHITEVLGLMPTAVIQSMFDRVERPDGKPFQLDRCHALETTGEAVRKYYPRWHRPVPRASHS